jgi:hypothetical protein
MHIAKRQKKKKLRPDQVINNLHKLDKTLQQITNHKSRRHHTHDFDLESAPQEKTYAQNSYEESSSSHPESRLCHRLELNRGHGHGSLCGHYTFLNS